MKKSFLCFGVLLAAAVCCAAELTVNGVFKNDMILQRNKIIPVSGTAAPGAEVSVAFKNITSKTRAKADGRWTAKLPALAADSKPGNLVITSGKNKKIIRNVVVGEVWILFGQSQIELCFGTKLRELNSFDKRRLAPEVRQKLSQKINADIKAVKPDPLMRYCRIWLNGSTRWMECNPKSIKLFSVFGYYLADVLRKELKVPVGIINMARGCSSIESWIPAEYFDAPCLKDEKVHIRDYVKFYYANMAKKLSQAEVDAYFTEYCKNPKRGQKGHLKDGKIKPSSRKWLWQHIRSVQPTANVENAVKYVMPFPVRGMLWWQGGTNYRDPAGDYQKKLQIVCKAYRKLWNEPRLPIVVILQGQSPAYTGLYSKCRLEQFQTVNGTANTFLVNNLMIPFTEVRLIHPYHEKIQSGKDAAALVLKQMYGRKNTMGSGPLFDSAKFENGKAVISFRFSKGLKTTDGKAPAGFEIAGKNKKYVPAQAKIVNGKVEVSSAKVPAPCFVRFMWEDVKNVCNLVNAENLTVFPFDTQFKFFQKSNNINR